MKPELSHWWDPSMCCVCKFSCPQVHVYTEESPRAAWRNFIWVGKMPWLLLRLDSRVMVPPFLLLSFPPSFSLSLSSPLSLSLLLPFFLLCHFLPSVLFPFPLSLPFSLLSFICLSFSSFSASSSLIFTPHPFFPVSSLSSSSLSFFLSL